jgi:hypothetical protein
MTATATDYDEIVRVVQLYVAGFNDCDVDKFTEAFHESAWIFFTDAEGALHRGVESRKHLRLWSSSRDGVSGDRANARVTRGLED